MFLFRMTNAEIMDKGRWEEPVFQLKCQCFPLDKFHIRLDFNESCGEMDSKASWMTSVRIPQALVLLKVMALDWIYF